MLRACYFKQPSVRRSTVILNWYAGVVGSTSESLNQQLSMEPAAPYTGRATVLIVGGAAEAMESKPGTYRILIKRRKGFVKLALKNGLEFTIVSVERTWNNNGNFESIDL